MQRRTILHSSYERALAAAKAAARAGEPTLGVDHATPEAFLEDAWELWGDGRRLVSPAERLLLMADAAAHEPGLPSSLGSARELARLVARYAGEPAFDEAVGAPEAALSPEGAPLGAGEQAALAAVVAYRARLGECGLVEPGEAAALLEGLLPAGTAVEAADALLVPTTALGRLLARLGAPAPAAPLALEPLPEGVRPRFLVAAGHSALAPLMREEALDAIAQARAAGEESPRVVVCAPDAAQLFAALAPSIAAEGARCELKAAVPFASTQVGRALAALALLAEDGPAWRQGASDFASLPIAGIALGEASRLDCAWRADRLFDAAAAGAQLAEASTAFAPLEALRTSPSAQAVERAAEAALGADGLSRQDALLERAAFDQLRSWAAAADALGTPLRLDELAEALSVPASVATAAPEGAPAVAFRDLRSLGSLAPASAWEVIVADMGDEAMGGQGRASCLDGLAEALGLEEPPSRFDEWRAALARAEQAPTARFACGAALRGADQEEAYPSFLFDELAAVLAPEDAEASEGLFELPPSLAEGVVEAGEEAVVAGIGHAFSPASGAIELPAAERGRLRELDVMGFSACVEEGGRRLPVLSPSAIEAYLQCPYRWFIGRKVGISGLDEGFGPREQGIFAHDVFRRLFERLAAAGTASLGAHPLEESLAAFEGAFDEALAAQPELPPGERLVAAGGAEALEVERLRSQMRESLRAMAKLPASFEVRAHEQVISPEDGIDYAGARLAGRVDRIDVDEAAGRFVVLDYKGSIAGHDAGLPEDGELEALEVPGKVQALVYARALSGTLAGLACAGALYLNYRAKDARQLAAGSYAPAGYDASGVASARSRVEGSFDAFLEAVERAVAPAVAALEQGRIAPAPAKGACRWCPVPFCSAREDG